MSSHLDERDARIACCTADHLLFGTSVQTTLAEVERQAAGQPGLAAYLARHPPPSAPKHPVSDFLALLYDGAFVAERYAAVGAFVDGHPDDVDPVVGPIIAAAGHLPAWQLFADLARLRALGDEAAATWLTADVLVVPSVPRLPTVAEVVAEPLVTNSMLGTYTNFVNLLDLAAVTLPVGPAGTDLPPTSLTLIGQAGSDELLAGLAGRIA